MSDRDFQRQVEDGYQRINNKWMGIHFRLLVQCMVVSGMVEIVMYFIIIKVGALNCSVGEYWLKYIIVPLLFNFCIVCMGYILLYESKVSVTMKQYGLSLLFVALSFVLELIHSGFVAVLVVAIFPVLMTVMYENQRLTGVIALSTAVTQAIGGYCIFWDPLKLVNSDYTVNLVTLLAATFCTWLTCKFMIDFVKMKREIILNNDLERFRLQRDINIDGLTGVGNKLALLTRLDMASHDSKAITYLAMLDLDHFKEINDTYGHIFGDDVLRCMGDALQAMQGGAEAYRYGGDEFCVVFAQKSLAVAVQEIEKVQAYLLAHLKMPDEGLAVFVSAGIAGYSHKKTVTEWLKQADEALYKAKKKRPNGVVVYGVDQFSQGKGSR